MRCYEDASKRPHGGLPETALKVVYVGLVIGFLVAKLAVLPQHEESRPTPARTAAILAEARSIRTRFIAHYDDASPAEAGNARNDLLALRDQLVPESEAYRRVQLMVSTVVRAPLDLAFHRIENARRSGDRHALVRAMVHQSDLNRAYMVTPPHLAAARSGVGGRLLKGACKAWLFSWALFVPFAFAICLVRLRRLGYSIADEIRYGFPRLVGASVFVWPFGLEFYPGRPAYEFRRARVAAEFLARKPRGYRVTDRDEELINALARAPAQGLAAALERIREVPASVVWRARFATYTVVFCGLLLGRLSLARADATNAQPAEIHGFLQVAGGVPNDESPFGLQRLRLFATARPARGLKLNVIHETSAGRLLDASATVQVPGSDFDVRVGQFTPRIGYLSPPPHKALLVGGPGAAVNLEFLEIGAELHGAHGVVEESLAFVSGSGGNQPDLNGDKDVIATFGVRPCSGLLLELALQTGIEHEEGRVTRGGAHASYQRGGFILDGLATFLQSGGDRSEAASAAVAYRTGMLRWSAGWDGVWVSGTPPDHIARAQTSVYPMDDDHLQISFMGRMSRERGASGTVQVQAGF